MGYPVQKGVVDATIIYSQKMELVGFSWNIPWLPMGMSFLPSISPLSSIHYHRCIYHNQNISQSIKKDISSPHRLSFGEK